MTVLRILESKHRKEVILQNNIFQNEPRTLRNVAKVCKQIIVVLDDAYYPRVEARCPGPKSRCPDSDTIPIQLIFVTLSRRSGRGTKPP